MMVNRPKAKGTSAESAIVRYARANGFAGAMRPAQCGARDVGDVWLEPGPSAIIESKAVAGPSALGQPPEVLLARWWAQTVAETVNSGAELGLLVVKRKGTTQVQRWFCWAPLWLACAANVGPQRWGAAQASGQLLDMPMLISVAQALRLARMAGYGDALDVDAAEHAS